MATFYVSSVAYAAIAAFQTSHAYSVGDIARPTAAASGRKQAYRCTTAGASAGTEAAWTAFFGDVTTQGTAVFTSIGGDTYGWSAALGDIKTVTNVSTFSYASAGDTVYIASSHAESQTNLDLGNGIGGTWTAQTTHFISVTAAGSVPPVPADITPGATITNTSGSFILEVPVPTRFEGVNFIQGGAANLFFGNTAHNSLYLKNCSAQISGTTSSSRITSSSLATVTFDNTYVSFGHVGQAIAATSTSDLFDFTWVNTASPIQGAIIPTVLFAAAAGTLFCPTCRGVDFNSFTGAFIGVSTSSNTQKLLLESCKISSSATFISGTSGGGLSYVELVNCWDGTNVLNGRVTAAGTVSTERSIILTSGAADDVGGLSFKMLTNASKLDKYIVPLDCFYFDVENTSTGTSKTATIEINASAALNNNDLWMRLEYMGTSGNPLTSFVDSLPATVLTTVSALSTSTATWSSSPATPVPQKLTATFTPQRAGRVRAQVFLGKASTTIYVNPQITIS